MDPGDCVRLPGVIGVAGTDPGWSKAERAKGFGEGGRSVWIADRGVRSSGNVDGVAGSGALLAVSQIYLPGEGIVLVNIQWASGRASKHGGYHGWSQQAKCNSRCVSTTSTYLAVSHRLRLACHVP